MNPSRAAVVVSHPAHLLTVVGLLLRWRPHVLLLNRTTGRGAGQSAQAWRMLGDLGLSGRTADLGTCETEAYERALDGDFSFHLDVGRRIDAWLSQVRPDAVFGDAYEASNYQHDVGRLLLDAAIERCRSRGQAIANHEFPLFSRAAAPGSPLVYGAFALGPFAALHLTAEELSVKRRLVETAGRADPFIAEVLPHFARPEREAFRAVSPTRDYLRPPAGLALYYDEFGREEVRAGRHARHIAFAQHFVPLVRALRAGEARRRAA